MIFVLHILINVYFVQTERFKKRHYQDYLTQQNNYLKIFLVVNDLCITHNFIIPIFPFTIYYQHIAIMLLVLIMNILKINFFIAS